MRSFDNEGRKRLWILEIHFVDKERQIGGFYEELLTVGPPGGQAPSKGSEIA
jgi:Xaa-Pro dipeptidase